MLGPIGSLKVRTVSSPERDPPSEAQAGDDVLDAYSPPTYLNRGDLQPIERDPKLVEAAIAAVRQYIFKPALKSGQAIAVWVTVPVAVPSER